ncbi:protein of unknown function [Loktanella sp. DSM 29012]|uniref:DUF4166 domain-containing protein n=1 Tax=Loktanella sp. DSM 29012 TaxID=1881056 RepID=UPI0008C293B9|nr:DUF4166 domain-containing protein [Loktanella sp. DSM 29012]SEQ53082.1 protein of unknown function [Loktanella sp. DSM 29012]
MTMPIFKRVLGDDFAKLPSEIQRTHLTTDMSRWQGRSAIDRGPGIWPRLLCALFRFPPAQDDIAVTVTKTVTPKGETWVRQFGRHRFQSHLSVRDGVMHERFGPFTFAIGLTVANGALHYPVQAGRLGSIPLPRWLLPISVAREYVVDGLFHFDVALRAPITRQAMVRYRGHLRQA